MTTQNDVRPKAELISRTPSDREVADAEASRFERHVRDAATLDAILATADQRYAGKWIGVHDGRVLFADDVMELEEMLRASGIAQGEAVLHFAHPLPLLLSMRLR